MAQEWLTQGSGIKPALAKRAQGWAFNTLQTGIEMMAHLPGFLIWFSLQTVFLLAALWIMIKVQKLNYHWLGLLGAAALASGIKLIPLPFHIADIISCTGLLFCIWKVTGAEFIDVRFTVGVGYALMFGMNLWLMGALMGDLRPSAREAENRHIKEQMEEKEEAAKVSQTAAAGTNRAPVAAKEQTVTPIEEKLPQFSVKSLIRNGAKSCVTLQSENDSRMIFLGDTELVHTTNGPLKVRFDGLTNNFVLLTVGEQQVKVAAR